MQIEQLAITALRPYERNSRTHSKDQINKVAASIKEFGFTNPVLIADDNTIIAGHGRVEAAKQLGLETVPVLRLAHLTPEQIKAYVIADNALAELAGWDNSLLIGELEDLQLTGFDITLLGIDSLEKLLSTDLGQIPESGSEVEREVTVTCPKCGYKHAA